MSGIISRFQIEALHNQKNFDVKITDNKLVIVGENGTGKSTVANFIYFFITRQWHKMIGYDFKKIIVTLDTEEIIVERKDIDRKSVV